MTLPDRTPRLDAVEANGNVPCRRADSRPAERNKMETAGVRAAKSRQQGRRDKRRCPVHAAWLTAQTRPAPPTRIAARWAV
eukprot:CAMPEP_0206025228 /NCGR_PEP_ID=MMETSP1464-20131121/39676_1 /ASSEMBLY_ACC=CAM_ASM_001124 /TAXON_ID=119497 /ORGANISM="Exanthemachrysis gayraliae, Strain RCC1523" /LENGTH=80 /DNA_ID=CAMNT_0053399261 /DNA_START=164 /DNA_END=402 /DNA_ORIENTATION=-